MRLSPDGIGPTLAMLLTLAVVSACILAVAVVAPDAAEDIGLPATAVGYFTGTVYMVAAFAGSFSAFFISRFGPIRVLQITAILGICGLVSFVVGNPLFALLCAILLGFAYGPINPANAAVLVEVTHAGNRSFMFSIKQTGVTMGGMFAAIVVPPIVVAWAWEAAILSVAILAVISLFILQSLQSQFGTRRKVDNTPWSFTALWEPVKEVMKLPLLRGFSLVGFIYAGVQTSVASFFVVYLVERGFDLIQAGACFLFLNIGGSAFRMIWGFLADIWSSKSILLAIGVLTTASVLGMLYINTDWPAQVLYLYAFILGGSSHAWNGVYLSEVAYRAPVGDAAKWTGGIQFIFYFGVASMPPLFGAIIWITGTYQTSIILTAVLALAAGLYLLRIFRMNEPAGV